MTNVQKDCVVIVLEELKHSGLLLAAVLDTIDTDTDSVEHDAIDQVFKDLKVAYDHLLSVGKRIKRVFDGDAPMFNGQSSVVAVDQATLRKAQAEQERRDRERETQKGVDPLEERWTVTEDANCRGADRNPVDC